MRDLSTEELGFVYGAGSSPMPPSKGPKKHKRGSGSRGKGSSRGKNSSRGRKYRCGKGSK